MQHTASPLFVCDPVLLTALVLTVLDVYILVSGVRGRGVFPRIKSIWWRAALLFLLILIFPLIYFGVLIAGCALV